MLSFSAPLAQLDVTVGDNESVPGLPCHTLNALRAKGLLPEDGFPIFIEPGGTVDETLLRFLLDVRTEGVSSLRSIRGYAQDVRVLTCPISHSRGHAGTSHSGFRAEVEREHAARRGAV